MRSYFFSAYFNSRKQFFTTSLKHLTMAHSKANLFDHTLFNQATWSRCQSHPARIIILTYLLDNGPSPFHELNRNVPTLSGPAVSQHIEKLIKMGVIGIERKYPKAVYEINKNVCIKLATLLRDLQNRFRGNV